MLERWNDTQYKSIKHGNLSINFVLQIGGKVESDQKNNIASEYSLVFHWCLIIKCLWSKK